MNKKQKMKVSKLLSFALRHNSESIGITMDRNGWVEVSNLLECLARDGKTITREELEEVVETNDKKRFAFSEDGIKIRASQGHSVKVDLSLDSEMPPLILYHGTIYNNIPSIIEKGLIKGNRMHVHLSADIETALKVGSRRGSPIVLAVRAQNMHNDGYRFFKSANGVWLVNDVPSKYMQILEG